MSKIDLYFSKKSGLRLILCAVFFLAIKLSSNGNGRDDRKKDLYAPVSITGEVIRTRAKATTLYKIGKVTIARGSVKHVSQHVGKVVTALCVIKKDRIVRINSIKVNENVITSSIMSLTKLQDLYKQDRSSIIKKYRNISHTYTAMATGIKSFSSSEYIISLHRNLGEIIISKFALPTELKKLLRSGKSKNITFTGSWVTTFLGTMVFRKITSIN